MNTSPSTRNSLIRSIALGGAIIGIVHMIIDHWLILGVILKIPFITAEQFITSGILGASALEGGLATALLGVVLHFLIAFVMAGVFILSAERIPFLRRYPISSGILYGFGAFVVMYFIVVPLSAVPPQPPPPSPILIAGVIEHILVVGLPVGILVQRNTNTNN